MPLKWFSKVLNYLNLETRIPFFFHFRATWQILSFSAFFPADRVTVKLVRLLHVERWLDLMNSFYSLFFILTDFMYGGWIDGIRLVSSCDIKLTCKTVLRLWARDLSKKFKFNMVFGWLTFLYIWKRELMHSASCRSRPNNSLAM